MAEVAEDGLQVLLWDGRVELPTQLDGVDIVRLHVLGGHGSFPSALTSMAVKRGFLHRPGMVTWVAPLLGDDESFVAGLSRKTREDVRAARRMAAGRFHVRIEAPLTPASYDNWLTLYLRGLVRFRRAEAVAVDQRDEILADRQAHSGIFVFDGEMLVAGVICQRRAGEVMRARLFARNTEYRQFDASAFCYLAAANLGRSLGCQTMLLGNDPNLFGYASSVGVMRSKSRLGFVAYPKDYIYPGADRSLLDAFINVAKLDDPTYCFAHPPHGKALQLAVVTPLKELLVPLL